AVARLELRTPGPRQRTKVDGRAAADRCGAAARVDASREVAENRVQPAAGRCRSGEPNPGRVQRRDSEWQVTRQRIGGAWLDGDVDTGQPSGRATRRIRHRGDEPVRTRREGAGR